MQKDQYCAEHREPSKIIEKDQNPGEYDVMKVKEISEKGFSVMYLML